MAPRPAALVTGASAGIGAAFARVFATHGFDLVLTARREDRLRALAAELHARHGVAARVYPGDLADPATPAALVAALERDGVSIDALVNNAGYGLPGRYAATTWAEQARFLQVMVTAVCELTHRLLPPMIARGYGRIVNVASLAGLVPASPGHTLYAASKAFLIKFSQALAFETRDQGVFVTAVCPGFTYTEFHDVNGTRELVRQLPRWLWMDAEAVAREGFAAVMAGRPVIVPGRVNRAVALAARLLPERAVVALTRRQSRKFRKL